MEDAVPLYSQEIAYRKLDFSDNAPPTESTANLMMTPASAAPPPLNNPLPLLLGPQKSVTTCPHCQCAVQTSIKHSVTTRTHMAAAACFFICFCCCIPYCSNTAKNIDHYCPNCNKYLGTYEK